MLTLVCHVLPRPVLDHHACRQITYTFVVLNRDSYTLVQYHTELYISCIIVPVLKARNRIKNYILQLYAYKASVAVLNHHGDILLRKGLLHTHSRSVVIIFTIFDI